MFSRIYRQVKIAIKRYFRKRKYLLEIIFGFLIIDAINFMFFREDPGFISFTFHPYWILLLFMPSKYGFLSGLLTGLTAMVHYLFFLFEGIPTQIQIEKMLESRGLLLPIFFVAVGIILGDLRQRHINAGLEKEQDLKKSRESMKRMKQWLDSAEKARRVLEARIVGQSTTVRALYEAAKELETLEIKEVYQAALKMLSKYFYVQKSSLYMREQNYYVLKASWGWDEKQMVEGKIPIGKSLMDIVFQDNKLITARDIISNEGAQKYEKQFGEVLAMVPIRNERETVGVINIEKMDFMAFNKPNLEMVELMTEWVGQAIRNIQFLLSAQDQMIMDPEFNIYNYQHFQTNINLEFARAKKHNLNLCVAVFKLNGFGFHPEATQHLLSHTLVTLLKRYCEEIDEVYRHRFDGTFAMIVPMRSKKDLENVFEKIKQGIKDVSGEITIGAVDYKKEIVNVDAFTKQLLSEGKLSVNKS